MKNKVIQCFMNVNFANQHDGLTSIAKKAGLAVDKQEKGDLIVFLNRDQTKVKILAPSGGGGPLVLAYARFRSRIDLAAVQYLSLAFDGGKINFDEALKKAVEAALVKRETMKAAGKKVSPLTAQRMLTA